MNNINKKLELTISIICNKKEEPERFKNGQIQINKLIKESEKILKININWFFYIWKDEITEDIRKKYCKTDNSMRNHNRFMKTYPLYTGEISLVLNHVNCLKKIRELYTNHYHLILESDFILDENFLEKMNSLLNFIHNNNINFNIINIGQGLRPFHKPKLLGETLKIDDNFRIEKVKDNSCSEAILWNIDSINRFLQYFDIEEDINGPWDVLLDELKNTFSQNFDIHMTFPSIVSQGSIKNIYKSKIR